MRVGIAGTDENKRITQAQRAMVGVVRGKTEAGAGFGIGGLNDKLRENGDAPL